MARSTEGEFNAATRAVVVYKDLPRAQLFRHTHLTRAITAPARGDKPVVGSVCNCDGLVLVLERNDNLNRTEDFILREAMVGRDIRKKCGRHISPCIRRAV